MAGNSKYKLLQTHLDLNRSPKWIFEVQSCFGMCFVVQKFTSSDDYLWITLERLWLNMPTWEFFLLLKENISPLKAVKETEVWDFSFKKSTSCVPSSLFFYYANWKQSLSNKTVITVLLPRETTKPIIIMRPHIHWQGRLAEHLQAGQGPLIATSQYSSMHCWYHLDLYWLPDAF